MSFPNDQPGGAVIKGSTTYDPPNIPIGNQATTTVTVANAALGDVVSASFSLDLQGIDLSAYVSSPNTVTCIFANSGLSDINLASGTVRIMLTKMS